MTYNIWYAVQPRVEQQRVNFKRVRNTYGAPNTYGTPEKKILKFLKV